jgi:hypothetical protein
MTEGELMDTNGHKKTPYEDLKRLQHAVRLERGGSRPSRT